jgi:hypothetical protein
MHKTRLTVVAGLLVSALWAYRVEVRAADSVEIIIDTNTVINRMQGGLGACIHVMTEELPVTDDGNEYRSWGGSAWGALPGPRDSNAWEQIFNMTDWLGLDWIRLEMNHRMYEPQKGVLVTDSNEMKILARFLDYCQSRNIDVLLQEMWPDVKWLAYPEFRNDRIAHLRSAPNDINAWADGFVRLVEFLAKEKRYTCIKWLSIANEPMEDWSWWRLPGDKSQDITPGLVAIRKRLKAKGLKVGIAGPDGSYSQLIRPPEQAEYCRFSDAISFHDYVSTFDWWDKPFKYKLLKLSETAALFSKWKSYAKAENNKPLFLSEFGTFMLGFDKDATGPAEYTACLRDVQQVIRLSNVGVDALCRWSLLNRGDLDGQWQLINTWDRENKKLLTDFYPQPNSYYILGLMTRFTAKYSDVLKTQITGSEINGLQRVFAVTYRSPTNKHYCLFVTNDSEQPFSLEVVVKGLSSGMLELYKYQITEEYKDKKEVIIEPLSKVQVSESQPLTDTLPPKSVVVYTSYNLKNDENGKIID